MNDLLLAAYERLILRRPWLVLALVAALVAGFATQLGKIKLDASADSLMLQGDPSLELYREISAEYDSEEFVLITWQPHADLLAPESLQPLRLMADELRLLKGVSSVVTVWDVPLLESPPVTLSDISSPEPLPSLDKPGIDLELVRKELTTSPIYAHRGADQPCARRGVLRPADPARCPEDETRPRRPFDRREKGALRGREGIQGTHGGGA